MFNKVVVFALMGIAVANHISLDDGDDGSYNPEKYELPYVNEGSRHSKPVNEHRVPPQLIYHSRPLSQNQNQQQLYSQHGQQQQMSYHPIHTQQTQNYKYAAILHDSRYLSADGKFGSSYVQEDGVEFKEESDEYGNRVGSYSYVDPTGQRRTVTYTAGKDGFQLSGDHLPAGPEVPQYQND